MAKDKAFDQPRQRTIHSMRSITLYLLRGVVGGGGRPTSGAL